MKGLILLLTISSIILLSIDGQDNQNINKTLTTSIDHEVGSCECITFYLCRNSGRGQSPSYGIIDLHYPDDGPCDNLSLICCEQEDKVKVPSLPSEIKNKPKPCGIRNSNGIGFRGSTENDIPNDNNHSKAEYGEFPWTIAVLREEPVEGSTENSLLYQCGASLIHPQVVLTSAYCVNSQDKTFRIRSGEWDGQTKDEIFPHQDRIVENVIIHPDFNRKTLENNVALLILDVPLELMENVQTVCLPPQNEVLENVTCFHSSWNPRTFEVERRPFRPGLLDKAKLPIVQHADCQEHLRRTRLGEKVVLSKSFICSEGFNWNGHGGPFVCPIAGKSNKYYLSGIQAFAIKPVGAYVNVASFRNWIDDEMLKLHFDSSTYII